MRIVSSNNVRIYEHQIKSFLLIIPFQEEQEQVLKREAKLEEIRNNLKQKQFKRKVSYMHQSFDGYRVGLG